MMKVYIVVEGVEYDYPDERDAEHIIGVYERKVDALAHISRRYDEEREGRGIEPTEDDGISSDTASLYDEQDGCLLGWEIQTREVW